MKLEPVTSTSIKAIGYDKATGTMHVQFGSGTYEYQGVSPETYDALAGSESVGKHFHSVIKPQFKGVKIG